MPATLAGGLAWRPALGVDRCYLVVIPGAGKVGRLVLAGAWMHNL
ncbi:MAG: hypothetical protein ACK54T_08980 [bacterium]